MWVLHCTALVHVHCIALRHRLIPQLPDDARTIAILCCRIIRGINIIDSTEPSVTAIWYLSNKYQNVNPGRPLITMTYALDFPAGKLWIAEQLDSVASRYLNRNAGIVAQQVRQTIQGNQEPNVDNTMRPKPSIEEKVIVQNMQSSPGPASDTVERDCYTSSV
jgi:hypothetical protein